METQTPNVSAYDAMLAARAAALATEVETAEAEALAALAKAKAAKAKAAADAKAIAELPTSDAYDAALAVLHAFGQTVCPAGSVVMNAPLDGMEWQQVKVGKSPRVMRPSATNHTGSGSPVTRWIEPAHGEVKTHVSADGASTSATYYHGTWTGDEPRVFVVNADGADRAYQWAETFYASAGAACAAARESGISGSNNGPRFWGLTEVTSVAPTNDAPVAPIA